MEEKRKASRFKLYQMIKLSYGREENIVSESINISETGILCKTKAEIEMHSTFFLLFELPLKAGNRLIKCEGVVIRSAKTKEGWEIGISFADMFPDDKEVLSKYLEELKS